MPISEDTFFLDTRFKGTLQSQIQQMVAEGILSGQFKPGDRLPSSRRLAAHLGVARITVTLAYTELLADDYLRSEGRSGYFVSENAPQPSHFPAPPPSTDSVDWTRTLTGRDPVAALHRKPAQWRDYRYPFIYGQADHRLFDHKNWRACALRALGTRELDALTNDYDDRDDDQLVEYIARHILPRRGIQAGPEEVLITLGAQNGLWLAAQVLLTQRRTAAIEAPCYPGLRDILHQTRCQLEPVTVDAQGLPPEGLPETTDVAFVTPSHQCPTNATMPLHRRKELLKAANEQDFLIVEDDYEFELSFLGAPHPALKSLDTEGRVIYAGSFSKSLFPGLRLGFLVGAKPFIAEARALRATVLRHPPGLMQRTTAHFLRLGHYAAQIRRMRRAYAARRETMLTALKTHGLMVEGQGDFGGSSVWMRAPEGIDSAALAKRLAPRSVLIEPGHGFFADTAPCPFYRLAYSSIPSELIPKGIEILAQTIAEMQSA
ncbi:PLP-dependent aminotransferase family protein [Alphaproteobacteria bacterium KMM 3653]|uniref:PLP-dependent aminotransferase family protein n=1 Tax=Harenicola maris TaxID=2841044 RepID=A0AAP2G3C9_9RHOB|nr:PLP-dependent aminotransferase family protein [Harenicola maris]